MASPTKRSSQTTRSGRARSDEGRRAKGQSDRERGMGTTETKSRRKRAPQAAAGKRHE